MATIHDEIESWLAADAHDQLSVQGREALHQHLSECSGCRQLHGDEGLIHKFLEETLAPEKADPTFEQRMVSDFRRRVPDHRGGIGRFLMNALSSRATQIAAAAVVLLALVQTGRVITHEGYRNDVLGNEELATRGQVERPMSPADSKVDRLDRGRDISQSAGGGKFVPAGPLTKNAVSEQEAKEKPMSAPNESERIAVEGSNIPVAEEAGPGSESPAAPPVSDNRKLIRNASVELEIVSFDEAVQKITGLANDEHGYVATSSSQKQANGKLQGEIIVKVPPTSLDRFLQKIRGLGELKNQTLGSEDVTKNYFDTDARLKNARVMEQRLIDMLKTKTGKVADLLEVEKELGRVREEIEKMQGDLKYWDTQVQFATVTISLAEKDLEEPAAFLLKERAQLALYAPEVEKVFNQIKTLASNKVQLTNAQLDRDNAGRVSASTNMLIAPEESESTINRIKQMGRVENFQVQTERVSQGGAGMSENAKTKRDKVELNITLSYDEQEQALQQTSLRIRTSAVDDKTKELRALVAKQNGRIRNASFSRDPDGREFANVALRVPMKNYQAMMQSLNSLGQIENVTVQRQDPTGGQIDEANAPADFLIQVYSRGNIVSSNTGIIPTLRRTLAQGVTALMWSARMIGVGLAFFLPWVLALGGAIWVGRRIRRARRNK